MATWGTAAFTASSRPQYHRSDLYHPFGASGSSSSSAGYASSPSHSSRHHGQSASRQDYTASYQDEQSVQGYSTDADSSEVNMAGFGARRFAESSRREAEKTRRLQEDRRRAQDERLRRMAEEQRRIQDQQARHMEQQRRAAAQQREEEERRRAQEEQRRRQELDSQRIHDEQARQMQYIAEQRAQHQQQQQQQRLAQNSRSRSRDQHSDHTMPPSRSQEAGWRDAPEASAQSWYKSPRMPHGQTMEQQPSWRLGGQRDSDDLTAATATPRVAPKTFVANGHETHHRPSQHGAQPSLASSMHTSSSSIARLAYDDPTPPVSDDTLRAPPSESAQASRGSLINHRATVYEDEYEEEEDEHADITANFSRYTHYGGPADDDVESAAPGAWSGARKSLFRATTYQPLPKAKCADCGEELDFEELTSHACEHASVPGTPILPMTPLTPLSTPGLESCSRSPFFDRYDRVQEDRQKLSAAIAPNGLARKAATPEMPKVGLYAEPAFTASVMARSASVDETGRSHDRSEQVLGLGLHCDSPARPQASTAVAPSMSGSSLASSHAGDSATERRRRIEAQREAARRAGGASPSPNLSDASPMRPTAALPAVEEAPRKLTPIVTTRVERRPEQRHDPFRNFSASSLSSASSAVTEASSLLEPASSPVSVSITPSSSFDRFSEGRSAGSPGRGKDFLSPLSAATAWNPPPAASSTSGSATLPKPTGMASAAAAAAAATTARPGQSGRRRSPPRELDLGGIEDLMEDLRTTAEEENSASSRSKLSPAMRRSPLSQNLSLGGDHPEHRDRSRAHRAEGKGDGIARARPPPHGSSSTSAERATRKKASSTRSVKLCCVCMCSLSSSSKVRSVEKDGKLFCAEDYKQLYLPKCTKCREPVEKNAVKSSDGALKGIFHRSCFCCFRCDARFESGVFYVFENAPYCFEHYSSLAGTQCAACGLGIEGQCRQMLKEDEATTSPSTKSKGLSPSPSSSSILPAGAPPLSPSTLASISSGRELYHPHCLTCQYEDVRTGEFCQDPLDDFWILGGRRLCEHHAASVQALLDRSSGGKNSRSRRPQQPHQQDQTGQHGQHLHPGHQHEHQRLLERAGRRRTMLKTLQ